MNRGLSCYLDLVRSVAAIAVFLSHLLLNYGCYDAGCGVAGTLFPMHAGHSAVVIFFVLSGYVITYVASARERNFRDYALSRCARIYSVAIPVLILVALTDVSFMAVGRSAELPMYQYMSLWKYLPLALTFTTDHWSLGMNALSHGGWWSISYEVWFYIFFAALFFPSGWKRWPAMAFVAALMGPKLLLLLPCWLMGSLVYRLHRGGGMSVGWARAILLVTSIAVALSVVFDLLHVVDPWADALSGGYLSTNLRYSQWFVGDTLLAGLFAVNIYAAKFARLEFGALVRPIKFVASFTFIFFMAHGMILRIAIQHFGLGMLATTVMVFICCYLLGLVTERQKDRLRRWLGHVANRVSGPVPQV
jgi:peptidoglycan/LPS O-acetylase OafA/YrhL